VVAEDLADRQGHLTLGQDAGRDLVEQRLEEVVRRAVDQRHRRGCPAQGLGGEQTAESGTDDHNAVLLSHHARRTRQHRPA
jgi:hypothetical protein